MMREECRPASFATRLTVTMTRSGGIPRLQRTRAFCGAVVIVHPITLSRPVTLRQIPKVAIMSFARFVPLDGRIRLIDVIAVMAARFHLRACPRKPVMHHARF
jgi:hypothetical protein